MWILGNNCSWMRYSKWGESSWHFQSQKQNPLYVQHSCLENHERRVEIWLVMCRVQTTVVLSTPPKIVQGNHIQSPACKAVRRRSMHSLPADTKERERKKKAQVMIKEPIILDFITTGPMEHFEFICTHSHWWEFWLEEHSWTKWWWLAADAERRHFLLLWYGDTYIC